MFSEEWNIVMFKKSDSAFPMTVLVWLILNISKFNKFLVSIYKVIVTKGHLDTLHITVSCVFRTFNSLKTQIDFYALANIIYNLWFIIFVMLFRAQKVFLFPRFHAVQICLRLEIKNHMNGLFKKALLMMFRLQPDWHFTVL